MKHLIIIGVGGFAREVYWHAQNSIGYLNEWDIKGFLDGDVKLSDEEYAKLDAPLLGNVFSYEFNNDDIFVCAIGTGVARKKMCEEIIARGGTFINLISKDSTIQGNVQIGVGNIICPSVHINDNAQIGDFVLFNIGVAVGHDSNIGSYSSFMGGVTICGYATVGQCTYWGTNAVAMPHSNVGNDVQVGVGSVVFKRVKSGLSVFGNPAMVF